MSPLSKQQTKLNAQHHALADKIRIHALGGKKKEAELLSIGVMLRTLESESPSNLKTLFENCYLRATGGITVIIGGQRRYADFGWDVHSKRGIYSVSLSQIMLDVNHPLAIKLVDVQDRLVDIKAEIHDLRCELHAVLDSVTTEKRLIVVWPEAKELIPEIISSSNKMLPALRTSSLNAAIGLPT
jgi:hypothetical protein